MSDGNQQPTVESLKAEVAKLQSEAADAATKNAAGRTQAAFDKALNTGRLTAAQKDWALNQSPEALEAFIESAPQIHPDPKAQITIAKINQSATADPLVTQVAAIMGVDMSKETPYDPKIGIR